MNQECITNLRIIDFINEKYFYHFCKLVEVVYDTYQCICAILKNSSNANITSKLKTASLRSQKQRRKKYIFGYQTVRFGSDCIFIKDPYFILG